MNENLLEIPLPDVSRTRQLGKIIGQEVEHRAFVALHGPLGAGKTTLVQGVGEGLGVSEIINSPTFTMLNEYHSGRLPLYHLDLYRMQDDPVSQAAMSGKGLEVLAAELDEFIHGAGITLIEWAEHYQSYLPADHLLISLDYAGGEERHSSRRAEIRASGPESEKLKAGIARILI